MYNDSKTNKMAVMPIKKLIITMALPSILSMLIQALYNMVDSIFVAKINNEALTALSLAFPIQMLLIAIFVGLGIGINSALSRKLGENDSETAANIAEHGFLLGLIFYIVLAVFGVIIAEPFFKIFTDDPLVIRYGQEYIKIILLFSFTSIFVQVGRSILQGTGEMIKPMWAQIIGAVSNIILDPILIFGLLGAPALGVKGAAIATVTAKALSMCYILYMVLNKNAKLKLNLRNFKFDGMIIKQILVVGLPATIMQALGSVMLIGLNSILSVFGNDSVAVLGIYYKVQSLVFMPVFGLCQGAMPVIGFNFGAKNKERIFSSIKFSTAIAVMYMTICLFIFQVIPIPIMNLFEANSNMIQIGIFAFRLISLSFPIAAISIVFSSAFQAMGKAYYSMVLSFIRQIIILLPLAKIFAVYLGLNWIWISFLIAEVIAVVLVFLFFNHIKDQQIKSWNQ